MNGEEDTAGSGVRGGKPKAFTARITGSLRAALDREAEQSGRTVGQVAQEWMDDARHGRASAEQILGGPDVAPALRAMAEIAQQVIASEGRPGDSLEARDALRAAMVETLSQLLPSPPPSEEELEVIELARAGDTEAAEALDIAHMKRRGEADKRGRAVARARLLQEDEITQARMDGRAVRAIKLWAARAGTPFMPTGN